MAQRIQRVTPKFSDAQLKGRACIHCCADDQALRAIQMAHIDEIQLVECIDIYACIARYDRRGAGSAIWPVSDHRRIEVTDRLPSRCPLSLPAVRAGSAGAFTIQLTGQARLLAGPQGIGAHRIRAPNASSRPWLGQAHVWDHHRGDRPW
jgi:hypothetical protein